MKQKKLSLLLLLSMYQVILAKEITKTVVNKIEKEHNSPENKSSESELIHRPVAAAVDSTFDAFDKLLKEMNAAFNQVLEETKSISNVVNKRINNWNTDHIITDNQEEIVVKCTLPEDIEVTETDLEIINNKVIRLKIENNGYTITVNGTLEDLNRSRRETVKSLSLTIQTEKVTPTKEDEPAKCSVQRSVVTQTIVGTPLLNEIKAEFDKETHMLTLVIPKKIEDEKKQTVRVAIK